MKRKHQPVGLDHRGRDESGQIHKKRSDTLVRTLRKEYGEHFAKGHRGDMTLGALLKKTGAASLSELLKKKK
jgi:hypothetical protein